jgi:two-component system chemotaxis response regulator CheB
VLGGLPKDLPVPVFIVQHIQNGMSGLLAGTLGGKVALTVQEGRDGLPVRNGCVYLAPGGWQMRVERDGEGQVRIALRDDPPENFCKPSVDYLFRSVAEVYAGRGLGVILTGIGNDGTEGLRSMKARGAKVIGQDQGSSVVYGMPRSAKEAGVVDRELPLENIPGEIKTALGI